MLRNALRPSDGMKYPFFSRNSERIRVALSVGAALPRMLTYVCALLIVLIAVGPLIIVWPTTLLAQSCLLARPGPCSQGEKQFGITRGVTTSNATPSFPHIVVVVEEIILLAEIIGNPQAPYINSLASAGVLLTNYHAVSHPSEPNYFALYAGSTFDVQDDGIYSEPDPTLATILQGNGESFIGYVESGSPQKHNPWESFPEGMSVERNMSTFPANDFSQLPDVSFVVPNLNDDMHDGTVAQADQWLSINIGAYAQWAVTHQSLLMVVWDEDDGTEGNQVPAILYGANIVPGAYNDAYTHYNLLHTLLDASGLSAPRNAALVPGFGNGIFSALTYTHDFNGDGKSDIAWRDISGDVAVWLMNGGAILQSASLGTVPSSFSIIGQHDFNGDGRADVLWRDTSGNVSMWFMNGASVSSAASVSNVASNWALYGTGDLNGDGKGDLLWRDSNTGTVAVWFMNGATVASTVVFGVLPSTWTIVGDANGEILWRDSAGDIALWGVQNGQVTSSNGLGTVTSNFVVQGVGDFNGDGKIDILWRDTNSGALSIWFTNGTQVRSGAVVGALPSTWNVAQVGDYNGDGKSDILLLDSAGDLAVWLMNAATASSSVGVGNVGPTWQVQNVNAN